MSRCDETDTNNACRPDSNLQEEAQRKAVPRPQGVGTSNELCCILFEPGSAISVSHEHHNAANERKREEDVRDRRKMILEAAAVYTRTKPHANG